MILGRYRQQPGEKRKRGVDYADFLEVDESISVVTAVVFPDTLIPLIITGITVPTPTVADPIVSAFSYFAEGGETGVTYAVEFTVETDLGQIKQDTIEFDIEEDT